MLWQLLFLLYKRTVKKFKINSSEFSRTHKQVMYFYNLLTVEGRYSYYLLLGTENNSHLPKWIKKKKKKKTSQGVSRKHFSRVTVVQTD